MKRRGDGGRVEEERVRASDRERDTHTERETCGCHETGLTDKAVKSGR